MTTIETKEIEIRIDDQQPRRLAVAPRCTELHVPTVIASAAGFGQIVLMFSGLRTDDGIEIWTPQKATKQ